MSQAKEAQLSGYQNFLHLQNCNDFHILQTEPIFATMTTNPGILTLTNFARVFAPGVVCWFLTGTLNAQQDTSRAASNLVHRNLVTNEFIENTYHHYTLDHLVSNYYDFAYNQINTMADFSAPDPYVFSLVGHSFKWNKYYYDGHRINDMYFPGTTLYKPFLYNKDVGFDLTSSEIEFHSKAGGKEEIILNYSGGRLGEKVPWYEEYVNTLQGHSSAFPGAYQPIELRKHLNNSGSLYFFKNLEFNGKIIPFSTQATLGSRDQIRFDFTGISELYTERFGNILLSAKIPLRSDAPFDFLQSIVAFQQRDNLFSEFYYDEMESSRLNQGSVSVWGTRNRKGRKLNLGLNLALHSIEKVNPSHSRNFIDQDGEGMEPWYPSANVYQLNLNHQNTIQLNAKGFAFSIITNNGVIEHNPKERFYQNPVYLQTVDTPFIPLYVTEWNSNKFTGALLENEANLNFNKTFSGGKFEFDGRGGFSFDGFLITSKSYLNIAGQLRGRLSYKPNQNNKLNLDIGRGRIPFNFDHIRFLSEDYYTGQSYFWNDANGDQQFQSNEATGLYSTTGGGYHFLGSNLKQPSVYYIDLSWDWHLGKNWYFAINNEFRSFRNLWTVEFDQDTASIGYFESFRGKSIFYFDGGNEINYRVTNFKPETLEINSDKKANFPFDNPFYAGSTMNLSTEGEKLFLSVSFSAYMIVGYGPTGNGPLHNSPGELSESLANPNNYINHVGRYDSDRAFIVRTLFGWKFSKSFSASLLILFKDGQPISTFETRLDSQIGRNQVAVWNYTNKGISPYNGQFGFREGAFWNYELKLKYDLQPRNVPFAINLYIYNLMDIATILNNYSFSPYTNYNPQFPFYNKQGYTPNRRSGMEVQIPRGFMIGLNYYFN